MYTLGYSFKPWTEAEGDRRRAAILNYVRETAAENGIDKNIRFGHRVKRASWSTPDARWTVEAERTSARARQRPCASPAISCSCARGYYRYAGGYTPEFPGRDAFKGQIVHPQKWPEDLDYADKRVVVIGSGATAVTLVPAMAKTAAHVTMLQRSPTYVVSRPAEDPLANKLRAQSAGKTRLSSDPLAQCPVRHVFLPACARKPEQVKKLILGGVRKALGPTTTSRPISRRATIRGTSGCAWCPTAICSSAIREERASVVTDTIETLHRDRHQAQGRQRAGGRHHRHRDRSGAAAARRHGGRGRRPHGRFRQDPELQGHDVFSDVPNLASAFGYTNASWTLKCDLTCEYVCRLLNYMDRHGYGNACRAMSIRRSPKCRG